MRRTGSAPACRATLPALSTCDPVVQRRRQHIACEASDLSAAGGVFSISGPLTEGSRAAQAGDIGVAVGELAQDLLAVLAHRRRRTRLARPGEAQPDGIVH